MEHELMQKLFAQAAKVSRVNINRTVGLATMLEQRAGGDSEEIISELLQCLQRLLAQNMNMEYYFDDDLLKDAPAGRYLSVEKLLRRVIGECTAMLEPLEWDLQLDVKCRKSAVKTDEKALVIVIMNLLQNALLYSPLKSTVIVTVDNETTEKGVSVCVSFKNLVDEDNSYNDCSGLGLPLCMKIARHYGGRLDYVEERGAITAKLSLPVDIGAKEEARIGFSSEINEFIGERYKPVRVFMQKILEREKG
jgi:signal transduction histidine kinase